MKIYGIEIDETINLSENIHLLRSELEYKWSFDHLYSKSLAKLKESKIGKGLGPIGNILLSFALIPWYFNHLFDAHTRVKNLKSAEEMLIAHYRKPETIIRRSRKASERERTQCEAELKIIAEEINKLEKNGQSKVISEEIRAQIDILIKAYGKRREKKTYKHKFYLACEQKLREVEEQLYILKSLQNSREQLLKLEDKKADEKQIKVMINETKLYSYYSEIIDHIAHDMKKVEQDDKEQIEKLELHQMAVKIRNK